MTDTEAKIIGAAIRTFVRYGAKKTSMADIAAEAGVSRQTLYDQFGGKDDLIVASIRFITAQNLAAVRERLAGCSTRAERLNAYFEETIIKSFELLQSSGDAEDLISGHNEAGKAAIEESHKLHEELIAEVLEQSAAQIEAKGQSVEQLAHFFVTTAMGLKASATSRSDLDGLIGSLKAAVEAIVS